MPTLAVESGPLAPRRYSFARRAVLGRGELADVRVEHETISRRHCEIRPLDDGWELVDLGSANGTRLNGEPVAGSAALADGDLVELGMVALRFVREDAVSAPPPVAGTGVFHETLARIALFCELGDLLSQASGEASLERALAAVRRAYPRVEHASLLVRATAGGRWSIAASAGPAIELETLAERAREGANHERGHAAREGDGLWALLPARYAGELVGALHLASLADGDALRVSDRDALCAVATFLAPLLAPARAPTRDSASDDRDLALARRIQQRFLPQAPPRVPGYAIVDNYTAARIVGGDHFEYLALGDGRTAIVVADVSGKAVSGALYMARLGPLLRQAAAVARDPATLLAAVDTLLSPELEAGMFVTMVVVALDPGSNRIEAASAGHPAPFRRHPHGLVEALEVPRGPPLGAMAGASWSNVEATLAPGDLVLLYTDGLDEAHDARQSLFGVERIVAVLGEAPGAAHAIEALVTALGAFVGDAAQSDDLTLVVLERS